MASQEMASGSPTLREVPMAAPRSYAQPLAIVTSLFFMWGFLTCLNDILVPHLKSIFDLSYARVMLVQFSFFSAYFLFSVPWSRIVNVIGYQRTMVVGLLSMAVGAFLFIPAASFASFPLFLGALIVLAVGITGLQVAANPYVVVLGKPETASSRLNLTQAFNSLGTTIAPKLGGLLILSSTPLVRPSRHCRFARKNCGWLRLFLLGWRYGWAFSRSGPVAQDQNRAPVGSMCRRDCNLGHIFHAHHWTRCHVEHAGGRPVQLHYVPCHLQS
jgi:MFS family permease